MTNRMPPVARVCLGPEDRCRLAAFAELDTEAARADLDQLENILNDYPFIRGVIEHPKPNEVRDLLSPRKTKGLKKHAEILADDLNKLPWQLTADFKASGFDLQAFHRQAVRFVATADAILALYNGETTARRPKQRVRDRHTIPEIADLFDRMYGLEADSKRDWEYFDNLCGFVTLALERASIPCPDAGDTRLSEEKQGRLRRLLKARKPTQRRRTRKPQ